MYPTVALDLDGVLLDFEAAWKTCAAWTLRRPVERITDDYALEDRFGLSRREVAKVWDAFHQGNWWERVHPYPEAWDLIDHLSGLGASVWAVTNVDARHLHARALSLEGMIPESRIITLGAKAMPEDRVAILRDLRAKAFLDDRLDNVHAALPYVPICSWIHRDYRGFGEPENGVLVIDDLRDFGTVLQDFLYPVLVATA